MTANVAQQHKPYTKVSTGSEHTKALIEKIVRERLRTIARGINR